jgi:cell division protein FtsB
MGNVGKRERYLLILLGIIVVVFLIWFFGIRNLNARYDELVYQRDQLQAQLDYYESLKTQNAEAQAQINQLKADITAEEERFLPYLCTEAIEQYVLKTFENAGCPYLVSVTTADITPEAVTLPNGASATDALRDKRITVQYSTTDGFCIPEYNRNITVISNGVADEDALNELLEEMYWHGADSRVGYAEFVSALETLEAINPDCIKLNSVSVKSEGGYLLLTAEIDFYSATFTERVSTPDVSAPYITWAGETNIDTEGGFIGFPFIVEDPNSDWLNVIMLDSDAVAGNRPFATYYSAQIFRNEVNARGLAAVLELDGGAPATEEPVEE